MTGGRLSPKRLFALFCAGGIAAASLATARPALADPNQDAGTCEVHASLTFSSPLHVTPLLLPDITFISGSETCTSALGMHMSWAGAGQALSASCTEDLELTQPSTINYYYPDITTSGTGTLLSQHWIFQSQSPSYTWTASGDFIPDSSVYSSPSVPTQQCESGGLTTLYLFGDVTFAFQARTGI